MVTERWPPWAAWGPTVLRVVVGFIFVMYGWDKFFGFGREFWADLFLSQGIPLALFAATVALALMGSGSAALDETLVRRQATSS